VLLELNAERFRITEKQAITSQVLMKYDAGLLLILYYNM
jgi:hypothetical protein